MWEEKHVIASKASENRCRAVQWPTTTAAAVCPKKPCLGFYHVAWKIIHSFDVLIKLSFVNGETFSRNSIVSNCWASLAAFFQRRNWTGKQCGPFKMKWSTKWLDSLVRKKFMLPFVSGRVQFPKIWRGECISAEVLEGMGVGSK